MSDELPSDAELESQFAAAMDAMLAEMREREHRVDEAPGARHREALGPLGNAALLW